MTMRERPDVEHIAKVQRGAERVFSRAEIEKALDDMAARITACIGDRDPVLLCVMIGGVVPLGALLPRLNFPLQVDYLHATRYRGKTSGGKLVWVHRPQIELEGRTVLIVDDVLDHGVTLKEVAEDCRATGAREVLTAVLVSKRLAQRPGLQRAEFAALETDDRYLYGWGMDYRSYLRNGDGIYAVKE
jgi:hypoxanthine phosphoribosyltransferase